MLSLSFTDVIISVHITDLESRFLHLDEQSNLSYLASHCKPLTTRGSPESITVCFLKKKHTHAHVSPPTKWSENLAFEPLEKTTTGELQSLAALSQEWPPKISSRLMSFIQSSFPGSVFNKESMKSESLLSAGPMVSFCWFRKSNARSLVWSVP